VKKYFPLLSLLLLIACTSNQPENMVMTVTGPIPATDMRTTLPHEHLLVDFIGADSTGYHRWDRAAVIDKVLPFLLEAYEFGVNTFIDCTPAFLGRDPVLLKELSEKSSVFILTTTGFYGAYNNKFVPQFAFEKTAEELAALWIDEFENGIEESGVRPGIIKIAVERDQPLSEMHRKIVQAAGLTHLKTGLTIVSHTGPEAPAYEQVELLDSMGIAPNAFVWTHANEGTMASHIELAQKGVWISLDKVNGNPETIEHIVSQVLNLKEHDLLDRVLISHDAGWYKPEQDNGGRFRPFTSIFTQLIPALKANGFSDDDIDLIMVKNPQKAFAFAVKKVD
jgi:phosphotriesterase-related protein